MAWLIRLFGRMSGFLALMVLVEFLAFVLYREYGVNRLYDTVRRLPLIWGAVFGALLAGADNLISWPIGSYVLDGSFRYPDEADPLIVGTSLLLAAVVGAIVAAMAGIVARNRRRHRSRRSALGKLAYTAFDEEPEFSASLSPRGTPPIADKSDGR